MFVAAGAVAFSGRWRLAQPYSRVHADFCGRFPGHPRRCLLAADGSAGGRRRLQCWRISGSVAGAYGLAYQLQRAGVPVYQAEAVIPAAGQALAFVIQGAGGAPVMQQPRAALGSAVARAGDAVLAAHLVDYRGQPFLVDAKDLGIRAEGILAGYPEVRRHQALLPFSAPVARVLTGLANRIVVTDSGTASLGTALTLAGLSGGGGLATLLAGSPEATGSGLAYSGCSWRPRSPRRWKGRAACRRCSMTWPP